MESQTANLADWTVPLEPETLRISGGGQPVPGRLSEVWGYLPRKPAKVVAGPEPTRSSPLLRPGKDSMKCRE